MLLSKENVWTRVAIATPDESAWLDEYLSFPDAQAHFRLRNVPSHKRGDGKVHLYSAARSRFPTGLIDVVTKVAADDGVKIELLDKRTRPLTPDATAMVDWLRSYQVEAIDVARGVERGVFHHATGCLDADTPIQYAVLDDGVEHNNLGTGTLETLYRRFHGLPQRGKGKRWDASRLGVRRQYGLMSVDEEGRVRRNTIRDVVRSGDKSCFRVRAGGHALVATADHKFLTVGGYAPLGSLAVGDVVFMALGSGPGRKRYRPPRAEVYVRFHPHASIHRVTEPSSGKVYEYRRLQRSRLVVEAHMNGLSSDEYRDRLDAGDLRGLVFLGSDQEVHHRNENTLDDRSENLEVLTKAEHARHHARAADRLRRVVTAAVVESIEPVGVRPTYDIVMDDPWRNFIAQKFAVHNSGKTELMVALGELLPTRWAILTNSKDLLGQTADRFAERTGELVGQIGEGVFAPQRVTVAMFQTLAAALQRRDRRVLEWIEGIEALAVDECHVVPADSFLDVIVAFSAAYYRYGFSATPFARGDRRSLYTWAFLGPIIHRVAAQRLIDAGVLAKPRIRMLPVRIDPLVADRNASGLYAELYSDAIINGVQRTAVGLAAMKQAERPCLAFVEKHVHGQQIVQALTSMGVRAEFVNGKRDLDTRKAARDRLVRGQIEVLVSTVIFQQGIDIPELRSLVFLGGGKSVIAALQKTGRCMRRRDAHGNVVKTEFDVYDVTDRGCGCHTRGRHRACRWLEEHARKRRAAYASEEYQVVEDASFVTSVLSVRANTATGVYNTK